MRAATLTGSTFRSFSILCLTVMLFALTAHARPGANGKIAFTSNRDGNLEIYVMEPNGTNQIRLTNNTTVDAHPAWSPDGRRIAFLGQRPTGAYAIFSMKTDGSERTEITPVTYPNQPAFPYALGWNITWSPDGNFLSFPDGNSLYIVRADGSGRRFLTAGAGPSWSPDGSKILFIDVVFFGGGLHTIRPDGTDPRTLAPLPDYYTWHYDATWSPSGTEIATIAFDGANEIVFLTNADGTNPRETVVACLASAVGCSRISNVNWSPNGRSLVFFVLSTGQLHAQDVDGGQMRQLTNTPGRNSHPSWQTLPTAEYDFDADARSDISVFRTGDSVWYLDRSTSGFTAVQFGASTDRIAPADYDGDGKTDIAVFRDGAWWRINSSDSTVAVESFGIAGDLPIPADYTGDGRDELAVYRNGQWWALDLSNDQPSLINFGLPSDSPVPADYDGDGRVDQAVYRNGEWHINGSTLGYTVAQFGLSTDRPVVADYDGDGRSDLAVYRDGTWYLRQTTAGFTAFQWGLSTDVPVPADYDGDGKADAAVFRDGIWYLVQSTSGVSIQQFGLANDKPVAAAYLP